MRLWSLHPQYLDPAGLVALWRESLLAQKVLRGETKGYLRHPQLDRFRSRPEAIATYLECVATEAAQRNYSFDATKIVATGACDPIPVARGQLAFEWSHLTAKLAKRNPAWLARIAHVARPRPHPLFRPVRGGIEAWERI